MESCKSFLIGCVVWWIPALFSGEWKFPSAELISAQPEVILLVWSSCLDALSVGKNRTLRPHFVSSVRGCSLNYCVKKREACAGENNVAGIWCARTSCHVFVPGWQTAPRRTERAVRVALLSHYWRASVPVCKMYIRRALCVAQVPYTRCINHPEQRRPRSPPLMSYQRAHQRSRELKM